MKWCKKPQPWQTEVGSCEYDKGPLGSIKGREFD